MTLFGGIVAARLVEAHTPRKWLEWGAASAATVKSNVLCRLLEQEKVVATEVDPLTGCCIPARPTRWSVIFFGLTR
jgi:hypothetical protein